MSKTIGRIDRTGRINFGEASLFVWEEGISSARAAGGYKAAQAWELQFKRDVFARIVQTLRRIGWTVGPWDQADQYKAIALGHRTCSKGDIKGQLDVSGRCIKFEMWQDVTPPKNSNGGRYDFGKEGRMPYLLRIEMERTRRRIRDYLSNVFIGYEFKPSTPKLGISGVTAIEYAAHDRRTSCHYVPALDRAQISNDDQGFSADGVRLENGTRVYAIDSRGRIICGTAFYSLNGNWQIVTGRYDLTYVWHNQIWVECPGNPRIKRNATLRRKRLEGELAKAITAMNFEHAALLRDILFPGSPALFAIWNSEHSVYHRPGCSGYTSDMSKAGKFTADEVRGWDRAPNKVIALDRRVAA
jgi:hypothetical protein